MWYAQVCPDIFILSHPLPRSIPHINGTEFHRSAKHKFNINTSSRQLTIFAYSLRIRNRLHSLQLALNSSLEGSHTKRVRRINGCNTRSRVLGEWGGGGGRRGKEIKERSALLAQKGSTEP